MEISIFSESERFENHLKLPLNENIIFSGVYGIGKTYFLKKFFDTNTDSYDAFILSPVNYSIANTEDIIEYFKYDIAFQLLGKDIEFNKSDFSDLLSYQFYIQENFTDTLALFAQHLGSIGKTVSAIYGSLKELSQKANQFKQEVGTDERDELMQFLHSHKNSTGTLYEENRITELIAGLIEKTKSSDRQSILVIDDLDRLDPGHIFRILNVFSAHLDFNTGLKNKFGFDKIVLVCDLENIRNIFHNTYGQDVDFSGYIDKFYSREIYPFNNSAAIISSMQTILSSIKVDDKYSELFKLRDKTRIPTDILISLITDLVNCNLINLRTLLKFANQHYQPKIYSYQTNGPYSSPYNNWQHQLILLFDMLVSFYGSSKNFSQVIEKLASLSGDKHFDNDYQFKLAFIIPILDISNHRHHEGTYTYINNSLDLFISYKLKYYGNRREEIFGEIESISSISSKEKEMTTIPYNQLIKLAFHEYENLLIHNG